MNAAAPQRRTGAAMPALLAGLAVAALAFWLALMARQLGHWPAETADLSGRAILGMTGKGDPSTLLAGYPQLPYVLAALAYWPSRLIGTYPLPLLTGLLAGGWVATVIATLRRARHPVSSWLVLALLICAHPLSLHAVSSGPQAVLLLWGVWCLGLGMFGFRATGGVNDLILLAVSLPLLAFTSLHGAVIAAAAIPFLLLAVPPQLHQRAFGSVYVVLLFPLVFAVFSALLVSWILLHDPIAFVSAQLSAVPLTDASWLTLAAAVAAVTGTLVIAPGLILRASTRQPLQGPAGALFGTMALSVMIVAATGLSASIADALMPLVAAAAVCAARWPMERGRALRTAALFAIGLIVAATVALTAGASAQPLALLFNSQDNTEFSPDGALGRELRGRDGVMIDAIAHPAVVAARGSSRGLETASTPAFQAAALRRRLTAGHVAVRRHVPGISDEAVGRTFPALYATGAPGYRLTYDRAGWRIWSRTTGATP